jgi:hypothetical protein
MSSFAVTSGGGQHVSFSTSPGAPVHVPSVSRVL